jgi:Cu-Zn family superoxide dismutase
MQPRNRSGLGRLNWAAVIAAGLMGVAACGGPAQSAEPQTPAATAAEAFAAASTAAGETASNEVTASGTLAGPESTTESFTYNPAVAPAGAQLTVTAGAAADRTTVRLQVTRLLPNRGYAAHVHQLPCGPTGAAAGPHHQHQLDPAATPEKASSDPAFANPSNEIWLDLRTDAAGNGEARAEVPFTFGDRRPASVIVHEAEQTATEPGKAGTAGARVACLNVPFAEVAPG